MTTAGTVLHEILNLSSEICCMILYAKSLKEETIFAHIKLSTPHNTFTIFTALLQSSRNMDLQTFEQHFKP